MSNAEASATPSYILQTKATRTKIAERRAAMAQTDVQDASSLSNKPVITGYIKKKKGKKTKKKEPAHAVAGSEAVEKSEEEKAAAEETQARDEEVASKPTATRKKRR